MVGTYEKDLQAIMRELNQRNAELQKVLRKPFASQFCTDHWINVIIHGQCWKHNPDGSFKELFKTKSL